MLTPLTADHRRALEQFANLDITIEELRRRLGDGMSFDFDGRAKRTLTDHFETAKPGVRVGRQHIENALNKRNLGDITEKELADWASMLVMNNAYDWQGPDEHEIANWLHDLSYLSGEKE
jgi:hypothetical protein